VPALVERLESDTDNRVRASAANALGYIGKEPEVAVPALVKHLRDPDPTTRAQAVLALAKFGTEAKAALSVIRELEGDANQFVREAAVKALEEIDPGTVAKTGVK